METNAKIHIRKGDDFCCVDPSGVIVCDPHNPKCVFLSSGTASVPVESPPSVPLKQRVEHATRNSSSHNNVVE